MSGSGPDAGNANWDRVQELFYELLDRPREDRASWLDRQTSGEPAIRAETESLLAALDTHQQLSSESSHSETGREEGELGQRLIGEFCGPYRLDRLIGQGGMAWVYEGARVTGDFRQRVAVKVLPAVFGEALIERFRMEKQILAELTHPGIAALLDGGMNRDGISWLVMEYVEGERITAYAAACALTPRDRIRLLLQVSAAVEFAHGRRIVHRDIKPANILVTSAGQPKLLDFGIARLLDQEGVGQATLWRAHTPGYASPEQLRGDPAGVATDIYQLGVLLGELLAGDSKTPDSDLAAIAGKARQYEPADRYASAGELAEDLKRYLEGLPVAANRGAFLRRAGKFARRYRGRLAAAALAVMAGAALLYQIGLRRQERVRRANDLYAMVIRQGESIGENVAGNRPELAYEVWRRLRDSVEALRRDDPGNPRVSDLLAHCYLQLGQLAWFRYGPSLMDADAALQSYRRARTLLENTPDTQSFSLLLDTRMYGSDILIEKGRAFDSFREVSQLLAAGEARRKVDPEFRKTVGTAELASSYDMLSDRLGAQMTGQMAGPDTTQLWRAKLSELRPGRVSDAIAAAVYQEAMVAPPDWPNISLALIRLQLGRLQHQAGRREQGISTLRESLRALLAMSPPDDSTRARIGGVHLRLSNAEEADGNLAEALREREQGSLILEEQFARNPQSLYLKERAADARIGMARLQARLGRNAEATRLARSGLQLLDENARRPHPAAITLDFAAQRWLSVDPAELRDPAKAMEYARRAVEQTAGQMPAYLETLAFAQDAARLPDDAARSARLAIEGYRKVFEILRPALESPRYPEASRLYAELRDHLALTVE